MFERTRVKLTRQFSLTVAIILVISVFFSLWMVQHILTTSENNQLKALSKQYADMVQGLIDSPKGMLLLEPSVENKKINASFMPAGLQSNQMAWVLNAKGQIVLQTLPESKDALASEQFPLQPDELKSPEGEFRNARADGRTFRIGGLAMNHSTSGDYRIVVAQEVTSDIVLIAQLRWGFIGFACFMLLAGAAAGYVLAGRAMVPISDAYRRQEQFTADASHELRTPLSILRSSVEVLNEQREALPAFHRNVLGKTGKEIHHLIRLVDNLLTLARSDSGRLELVRAPFSLRSTVRQVMEQLEPIARNKQVYLTWADGTDTIDAELVGDEVRIRQLVFILAENAIQYNRDGGSVMFGIAADAQGTLLTVTDTGIGIEKDHLTGIFERFYRMDQARTRRSEGTGLGLAIAKQIVLSHGGKIQAASEPAVGTTFRVTLPNVSD